MFSLQVVVEANTRRLGELSGKFLDPLCARHILRVTLQLTVSVSQSVRLGVESFQDS